MEENNKIIASVDGSQYTDSVCAHAAWVGQYMNALIQILYVQPCHSGAMPKADLSGYMGINENLTLLENLAAADESWGKCEQRKGKIILQHAKAEMEKRGVTKLEFLHRRGEVESTLEGLEESAQLIVVGKRGETKDKDYLGSHLEYIIRAVHRPILVCAQNFKPIRKFAVVINGGLSLDNALDYALKTPFLKGLKCHLMSEDKEAKAKFQNAGFDVSEEVAHRTPDETSRYITENTIDLLIIGTYTHSHLQNILMGSQTESLLLSSPTSVLVLR